MCCMQKLMTSPPLVAMLSKKFGSAIVKWLHFHPKVCFLLIPFNAGVLRIWPLFFGISHFTRIRSCHKVILWSKAGVYPCTPEWSNKEMHIACSLWFQSLAEESMGVLLPSSVREVWGPHFVSFVSWWLACISLTQVNMPTNVPPAHFPPWQSASWKSTPWKCMGKHWPFQDPALSTLQPHTPITPPRTTLQLKKWRTLMVRGASKQEFNCLRCHLILLWQKK